MKSRSDIYLVLFMGILLFPMYKCKKEAIKNAPTVTITTVTNITSNSANSGGVVTADGGASLTASGVCWSISQDPTISDSKTSDGSLSGSFISHISGLTQATTYYLKAYATNSA